MSSVALQSLNLGSMSENSIRQVQEFERVMQAQPQVAIETSHVFHAGTYARTIMIPKGVALTGALIKINTLLIIEGNCVVTIGEHARVLVGYNVIAAEPNRKTAYYAYADTYVTMIFATNAASVEEAEDQFTDEAHRLVTRQSKGE